ncbi:MAG: bifunctional hydroxymethylpyrimidine kinase/phosphomethylpyrimidine kinase [Magnetococcales bacterium]|nr:bifunctional hydroxymethylpyrimidine kinase/phosphomethylpyrimidine kinase [Magnetococcales bacterium]
MRTDRPPTLLIVAGSDPTAGAGLQADLKTATCLGVYAYTAVTAITLQDGQRVHAVHPLEARQVAEQMRICLTNLPVDAIKLGMLANRGILLAVSEVLHEWPHIPVIADPVLAGTGGGTLLESEGTELYLTHLLPHITLLTPNLPEAERLSGLRVRTLPDMEQAARRLAGHRPTTVLITGGHLPGDTLTDLLWDGKNVELFHSQRLPGPGFHGTGCTLTTAIAVGLAQGKSSSEAVRYALLYLRRAMIDSLPLGAGQRLLNHPPGALPLDPARGDNPPWTP